jgi:hypothetical protein
MGVGNGYTEHRHPGGGALLLRLVLHPRPQLTFVPRYHDLGTRSTVLGKIDRQRLRDGTPGRHRRRRRDPRAPERPRSTWSRRSGSTSSTSTRASSSSTSWRRRWRQGQLRHPRADGDDLPLEGVLLRASLDADARQEPGRSSSSGRCCVSSRRPRRSTTAASPTRVNQHGPAAATTTRIRTGSPDGTGLDQLAERSSIAANFGMELIQAAATATCATSANGAPTCRRSADLGRVPCSTCTSSIRRPSHRRLLPRRCSSTATCPQKVHDGPRSAT